MVASATIVSAVFAENFPITSNANITLVKIPTGEIRMSSATELSKEDKKNGKKVERVSRKTEISEFNMSLHEISYEKYKKVYDWGLANGYQFLKTGKMGAHNKNKQNVKHTPQEPVFGVSWYDCVLWCNAASEMEKREPSYYTDKEHINVYRKGKVDLENDWVKWNSNGYRLPTEAEWTYACDWRTLCLDKKNGGIKNWEERLQPYAWDGDGSGGVSHPVGTKKANAFGLYDMYGNAHEWLWDRFRFLHDKTDIKDPRGPSSSDEQIPWHPAKNGTRRVCLGIWYDVRNHPAPKRKGWCYDYRLEHMGFRVATSIL